MARTNWLASAFGPAGCSATPVASMRAAWVASTFTPPAALPEALAYASTLPAKTYTSVVPSRATAMPNSVPRSTTLPCGEVIWNPLADGGTWAVSLPSKRRALLPLSNSRLAGPCSTTRAPDWKRISASPR